MMLAAKMLDPLVGIDIHIVQPPGPVPPVPIPHPYVGIVFDPMDLAPYIGATVSVNHLPRAQAGTAGKAIPPHIPIGGMFVKPPSNESEMFMGSATVAVDGDAMTYLALPVLSCQDVGMIAPPRPKKKSKTMSMVLPTTVVLPIPAGPAVLVGGPPTISLMALGMRVGMAALGKAFKKLRALQKGSKRMKAVSDRVHRAAQRAMDRLGVPPSVQNRVHRAACAVTGHPVDVATGKVFTEFVEIELPGPVPFTWERVYFTSSVYDGPLGRNWHHGYDLALAENGRAVALRLPDGRQVAFAKPELGGSSFDAKEQLTLLRGERNYSVRTGDDLYYRFLPAVEGIHRLARYENRFGEGIAFDYDARGTLRTIIDSAGRRLDVDSDQWGRIVSIRMPHPTDPNTQIRGVVYQYDAHGDLVQSWDACQESYRFRYVNHLLVAETNPNGLTFYFEYDGDGPTARCLRTWGDGGLFDHKLRYVKPGEVTEVEDSLGHVTRYELADGLPTKITDPLGHASSQAYGPNDWLVAEVDENGAVTEYEYDERGNRTLVRRPDGSEVVMRWNDSDKLVEAVDYVGGIWRWQYDALGRLLERIDPLERVTRYHYEGSRIATIIRPGNRLTAVAYDAAANPSEVRAPDGHVTRWYYDLLGRPVLVVDPKGNETRRSYDGNGRVVRIDEPDGNVRALAWDGMNNLVHVVDGHVDIELGYFGLGSLAWRTQSGTRVEFKYDTEEQLVAIRNEHGFVYRFEHDAAGHLDLERAFDGATRRYTRDPAGRVVKVTHASGKQSQYTFDACDRLLKVQHEDGFTEEYAYRADDGLIAASIGASKVRFERDLLGRVTKEWQGPHFVTSAYDDSGYRVHTSSSLGFEQTITRNVMGDVERVQAHDPSQLSRPYEIHFQRDALGLEIERQLPGGVISRWTRDRLGRAVQHEMWSPNGTHRHRQYQWTFNDRLVRVVDSEFGPVDYGHDGLEQLAWAQHRDGTSELRMPDAVGNLFRTQDRSDREYSPSGQLLAADTPRGRVRYEYDLDGNLLHKHEPGGGVWTYHWNGSGMLVRVERPDGDVVTFDYDALSRRISKSHANKTTYFVWDGSNPLHEWTIDEAAPDDGSTPMPGPPMLPVADVAAAGHAPRGPPPTAVTTWLFEPETRSPIAKLSGAVRLAIVGDHLGTPIAMFNELGTRVWSVDLDTRGAPRRMEGERSACPFRYAGQYDDPETGLYYNRFRYYDPDAGTYISRDPIGLAGGLALYAYVNDPLRWLDPVGLAKGSYGGGKPAKRGPARQKSDANLRALPPGRRRTPAKNAEARRYYRNNRETAMRRWEERTGQQWPTDANGRPQWCEHPRPLKEGGDPLHVEPGVGPDPNAIHNVPGPDGLTDAQRWGALGPPARGKKK